MTAVTTKFIKLDLNEFKLHLCCRPEIECTLYFNTPSRKFYLAVMALIINEMKKKKTVASIPLQHHLDELILLNRTIGKEAGSSKKELLLHRIYRKWKDALPDLGKAPLFQVIGRKKRYDDSMDKVYIFSEEEKDCWANLFDYMGSHENVKLKFAINKLSLGLEDIQIDYGESLNDPEDAWGNFIEDLKQNQKNQSSDDSISIQNQNIMPEPIPISEDKTNPVPGKQKPMMQFVMIGVIFIIIGFLFWQYKDSVSNIEVASNDKMGLPLPENPSIAVLAFDNMTGDPTQEYFSDGISEEIITVLSNAKELFVIARNSSFSYKRKLVKVQQIGSELGVRYVLEGSVRKADDKVRVTTQLIDAKNGQHLWAKSYDRDFDSIFEIQDEISMEVATSLRVKLTEGEQARMFHGKNRNPEVRKKHLQSVSLWREGTGESMIQHARLAQEIIDIAPESEIGYRVLGWNHWG